jgi:hypothetical protein
MKKVLSNAKALYVGENETYVAKGYTIYKSKDCKKWNLDGKIIDSKYTLLSHFSRMLNRLLRIEPSNMLLLHDGSRLLSAKKGIFVAQKNSKEYKKTFHIARGNKPLNICMDRQGNLYFGEYVLNGRFVDTQRSEVHIYRSQDNGRNWEICYTFPKNTIRHIHGIFYDAYTDRLWVTTGDQDDECMIAYSEDAFKTLHVLKQGAQRYRAVTLLFYADCIIYGTDTEHEQNYIYSIDRHTGKERVLQALQGSVLMATQNGNRAAISTAVEPSEVNHHPYAHVWFSEDGDAWKDVYRAKKDRWSARYFQYGRITFPQNAIDETSLIFSGHALEGIENTVFEIKI